MKKTTAIKSVLFFALILLAASCKEKKDTLVEIQVADAQGNVIENAFVELSTSPPYEANSVPVLNKQSTSNSSGIARFNFNDVYKLGQAGVAVLEVSVTKGSLSGTGIVKIEEEVTSKERVVILP